MTKCAALLVYRAAHFSFLVCRISEKSPIGTNFKADTVEEVLFCWEGTTREFPLCG
jgi:hypothetical protein